MHVAANHFVDQSDEHAAPLAPMGWRGQLRSIDVYAIHIEPSSLQTPSAGTEKASFSS